MWRYGIAKHSRNCRTCDNYTWISWSGGGVEHRCMLQTKINMLCASEWVNNSVTKHTRNILDSSNHIDPPVWCPLYYTRSNNEDTRRIYNTR